MENKELEEIASSQKNFLSAKEAAAILGISPLTFRRRWEEYAEFFPIQNKLKKLFAGTIEQMLEAEMDEHLGYEKNSVLGNNSGNSRNGYCYSQQRHKKYGA